MMVDMVRAPQRMFESTGNAAPTLRPVLIPTVMTWLCFVPWLHGAGDQTWRVRLIQLFLREFLVLGTFTLPSLFFPWATHGLQYGSVTGSYEV